jgi:hypothetical protein
MANWLSTRRNIETSLKRIQNSRLSSLHLLLSQLIILPTHKRCQMHWTTTTLKKEMNPVMMTSKLFGAWWVLEKNRRWLPWFPLSPYFKKKPRLLAGLLCKSPCTHGLDMGCLGFDVLFNVDNSFHDILPLSFDSSASSSVRTSCWLTRWHW